MKTRRKIEESNIRKLTKVGGGSSYSITLPIDVIRKWGWRDKQKLVIAVDEKNKALIIKDWEK
jgi:bifunctional DNA-binding transcriptional regulator/antitoxin component of YhaV-PrlF toxin-antitoxin module